MWWFTTTTPPTSSPATCTVVNYGGMARNWVCDWKVLKLLAISLLLKLYSGCPPFTIGYCGLSKLFSSYMVMGSILKWNGMDGRVGLCLLMGVMEVALMFFSLCSAVNLQCQVLSFIWRVQLSPRLSLLNILSRFSWTWILALLMIRGSWWFSVSWWSTCWHRFQDSIVDSLSKGPQYQGCHYTTPPDIG